MAELLCNPCNPGGHQTRGKNQKWLPHPCVPGGPKRGRNCYITPASSRIPKQGDKIRSGCLTSAFLEGPKEGKIAM